jgi:hypothetical protein
LRKALEHIPTMVGWSVQEFNKQVHERLRGKTGGRYKVHSRNKNMTLDNQQQRQYKKSEQTEVGSMKAGWGISVQALGGRVPAWIARNIRDSHGGIEMNIDEKTEKPFIRIWNDAPSIGRFASAYEWAVQQRVKAIGEKVFQALERRAGRAFKYKGQ